MLEPNGSNADETAYSRFWTPMKLLASSVPEKDRNTIVYLTGLLTASSIMQAMNVESSYTERVSGALVYLASAFALARNWRYSQNIALVLILLITIAALIQLFFSALGVASPPVPRRSYVSLVIAIVVLVLTIPALVWLWRHPHKGG